MASVTRPATCMVVLQPNVPIVNAIVTITMHRPNLLISVASVIRYSLVHLFAVSVALGTASQFVAGFPAIQ
jgi:hypothetical protein